MASSAPQPSRPPRRARIDGSVPALLRPLLRAFILGYGSSVAPRILTLVLKHVTRWRLKKSKQREDKDGDVHVNSAGNGQFARTLAKNPPFCDDETFFSSLQRILIGGLDPQRFPTFCAALIGGSTLLDAVISRVLRRLASSYSTIVQKRLSRWFATFIASWLSIQLLHSKHTESFSETVIIEGDGNDDDKTASQPTSQQEKAHTTKKIHHAGRTLDLTLFAATRAVDVLVGSLWVRWRAHRREATTGKPPSFSFESLASSLADPAVFAASCSLIMWAWFYHPTKLRRAYQKWITSAAAVDGRLIEALRRCRAGIIRYGDLSLSSGDNSKFSGSGSGSKSGSSIGKDEDRAEEEDKAQVLRGMCRDYGWPIEWGDPTVSVPYPCEMVHMGSGKSDQFASCERHAVSRFLRSWRWAMATYLPLNVIAVLVSTALSSSSKSPIPTTSSSHKKQIIRRYLHALRAAGLSASRSSSFLGLFIALFYYGVCLARTRVGPLLLGSDVEARQRIDAGICVGSGCALCGWSVLLEKPVRVANMALFVAPRAAATVLPRRYDASKQWRETLAFSASTAVVFTCALENKARVRGLLGTVLKEVLEP